MKKRVAIIITKLYGGGAEHAASRLSIELENQYEVFLIVFDGSRIEYPYGGKLIDLGSPATNNLLAKLGLGVYRANSVNRIKKDNKIDACISFLDGPNLINIMSGRNAKIITSIRNQVSSLECDSITTKIFKWLKMKCVGRFSKTVVAVSEGVERDLIDHYGINEKKVCSIANMVEIDEKLLLKGDDRFPELSNQKYIFTMGRMTEQKGHWHLIRAFSKVVNVFPEVKLCIAGEGKLKDKLQVLVNELHLENKVIFCGFVESPYWLIKNSKLFVLSSLYEGMSNALLEAMACGTPCIATDCFSGSREIIEPGTEIRERLDKIEYATYGILTSVGDSGHFNATDELTVDEEQMAEAVINILSDDKLRKHYCEMAEKRSGDYSPNIVISKWCQIIDNK